VGKLVLPSSVFCLWQHTSHWYGNNIKNSRYAIITLLLYIATPFQPSSSFHQINRQRFHNSRTLIAASTLYIRLYQYYTVNVNMKGRVARRNSSRLLLLLHLLQLLLLHHEHRIHVSIHPWTASQQNFVNAVPLKLRTNGRIQNPVSAATVINDRSQFLSFARVSNSLIQYLLYRQWWQRPASAATLCS